MRYRLINHYGVDKGIVKIVTYEDVQVEFEDGLTEWVSFDNLVKIDEEGDVDGK